MGFHTIGPVTLGSQETSPIYEFPVLNETVQKYLRFIALWRDNKPLGGEAPTFQIRAGTGVFTSVGPDSGDVSIPGSSGDTVGKVTCEREPKDIFLLTLSYPRENSGPWMIRIRNNDSEPLTFLGFVSHPNEVDLEEDTPEMTRQPYMVLSNPDRPRGFPLVEFVKIHWGGGVVEGRVVDTEHDIEVRNMGTAPLTFNEAAGTRLGEQDLGRESPVILVTRPDRVDPHGVGYLTIGCNDHSYYTDTEFEHFIDCNDAVKHHTRLSLKLASKYVQAPEPPTDTLFCRRGCGCLEYLPPAEGELGRCRRCGHSFADHTEVRPNQG